ncbi:hypothetical protein, partial [Plasmodium yoelii yoelii]
MKQDGKLKIPKINLLHHKKFILKTDLVDSHVYIFKNYVLDIIEKKKKFSSIKYDLIPYLVNIQNMGKVGEYYNKSEFKFNMYKTLINEYSAEQSQNENVGNEANSNGMANVANLLVCLINYPTNYPTNCPTNYDLYKDCIIGSGFEHEEN